MPNLSLNQSLVSEKPISLQSDPPPLYLKEQEVVGPIDCFSAHVTAFLAL